MAHGQRDLAEQRESHTPKLKGQPSPESGAPDNLVESLQRAAGNAAVSQLLGRGKEPDSSTGTPLAPDIRATAERTLGADLGQVRVHSGPEAADYAGSLRADGVTVGQDVFLGSEAADSSTARGRKTLLHELVHAVQAPADIFTQARSVSSPSAAAEREASQIANHGLGGGETRPAQTAAAGVAHRKTAEEDEPLAADENGQPAPPAPTAEELLNPPTDDTDPSPKPGASGENEAVVYEITVMAPLRDVLAKIENQDWDEAMAALQAVGMRLLDYQNIYEKKDPMLYTRLMSARGWLSVAVQHVGERLGKGEWTDGQIADHIKDDVGEFQSIASLIH